MKISLTVQMTEDDGPADDIVIQNLKDVGFEIETGADGLTRMTYRPKLAYAFYTFLPACQRPARRLARG